MYKTIFRMAVIANLVASAVAYIIQDMQKAIILALWAILFAYLTPKEKSG